jgi:hypothetical protein
MSLTEAKTDNNERGNKGIRVSSLLEFFRTGRLRWNIFAKRIHSQNLSRTKLQLAKATLYALIKMCAAWYEKTAILAIVGANDVLVCTHPVSIQWTSRDEWGGEFLRPCPIHALFRTMMVRA